MRLNSVSTPEDVKIEKLIEQNVAYIGSIGIGVALIQVIGVICSCCLARTIKNEYETV